MNVKNLLFILAMTLPAVGFSQSSASTPSNDWQHLDKMKDGIMGVSSDKMHRELLKGKKSETVIVAVIDGGVDPLHEDLKDIMWNNPGEIPNNGKDDDGNGYIDDVYGWNFIGGKDGKNIHQDQLEITRLYKVYREKFKNVDPSSLKGKERKLYDKYVEMGEEIDKEREGAKSNAAFYGGILDAIKSVVEEVGTDNPTMEQLKKLDPKDEKLSNAVQIVMGILAEGDDVSQTMKQLQGAVDYFAPRAEFYYNPDIEVRGIVGDNYSDSYEKYYGNNDVKGPDASHGTHVAGLIAATRNNGIGMNGVADNVKIMAIRAVPDGDERDKDVANSIIYAVDNGASIINMSFGKGYSWDKKAVDKAMKYAMKNDVLLVHAAGNSSQNNDSDDNFPNDEFEKKGLFGPKKVKTWMEIGALSWKGGKDAVAGFSNYGKENVDLFAPGHQVYSTLPDNGYDQMSGTSMAAPVAAGVAAVIRSYYPDLNARQVKDVLMSSTVATKNAMVIKPGTEDELVPFSELSVTGGVINSFEAVKKASSVKPKKKKNKWRSSGKKASSKSSGEKKNRV